MKTLLTVTAILEGSTGLALAAAPSALASVLVGASLDSSASKAVARIASVALLSLAIACWAARRDTGSHAARGIIAGMLFYNGGVAVILVHGALASGLTGLGLWPTVGLHIVFAVWCVVSLAPVSPRASAPTPPG